MEGLVGGWIGGWIGLDWQCSWVRLVGALSRCTANRYSMATASRVIVRVKSRARST